MSNEDGAICGGCCAILCATTLGAWCNLKAFGGGNGRDSCCGGPRGCCHSCFSDGFDEDAWDKKDSENRQKGASSAQPAPTPQMNAAPAEPTATPQASDAPAESTPTPVADPAPTQSLATSQPKDAPPPAVIGTK